MWASVLSESEVKQIYELLEARRHTQAEIAAMFHVSRWTIRHINFGTAWARLRPVDWRPSSTGPLRGEKSPRAILTNEEAAQVKKLAQEGTYTLKQIAGMFGVSESTIFDIRSGRSWKHLRRNETNAASAA